MKKLLQQLLEQKEITKSPLISMRGNHEDLFYTFSLDTAAEAEEVLNKLRAIKYEIDYVPICLGDIDDFNFLIQHLENHSLNEINSILRSASALDLQTWKMDRALAILGDLFAPRQCHSKRLFGLDFPSLIPPAGPIFIELIPDHRAWVAAAYLNFGGTDDNPSSLVHCRILRNFEARLSAHVYAIGKDEIGLVFDTPLTYGFLANEFRKEMFLYFPVRDLHFHNDDVFFESVKCAKYWHLIWNV